MLEEIFLQGDAHEHRIIEQDGRDSWELASLADPKALLMTVHDWDYRPDLENREFVFRERQGQWQFRLPRWLDGQLSVFAIGEDGPGEVEHTIDGGVVQITDSVRVVGIFVATVDPDLRDRIQSRFQQLKEKEKSVEFDPAGDEADLQKLKTLLN